MAVGEIQTPQPSGVWDVELTRASPFQVLELGSGHGVKLCAFSKVLGPESTKDLQ